MSSLSSLIELSFTDSVAQNPSELISGLSSSKGTTELEGLEYWSESSIKSNSQSKLMEKGFNILIIPLHSDNFCYYVYSNSNPLEGALIDVGDASVVEFCKLNGFTPKAILSTHKHWDHTNGNSAMKKHFKDLLIYGGELDNVPECTNKVKDGDWIEIGDLIFNCYHVPCHTKGHILYHIDTGLELEYSKTKEDNGVLV